MWKGPSKGSTTGVCGLPIYSVSASSRRMLSIGIRVGPAASEVANSPDSEPQPETRTSAASSAAPTRQDRLMTVTSDER